MSNINELVTGQIISTLTTGTMPLAVTSTTECTNLNVSSNVSTSLGFNTATTTVDVSASTDPIPVSNLVATSSTSAKFYESVMSSQAGASSTNTSVGTHNLEIDSPYVQRYFGTTSGLNVYLPGIETGNYNSVLYCIINNSTQTINILSDNGGSVVAAATNTMYFINCWFTGQTGNGFWIKAGPVTVA